MGPNDVDGMTNSEDPIGAVWSESTLFAQGHLSVWKLRIITVLTELMPLFQK